MTHPDAFDNDLLIQHLKELKAGRAIDCPVYDYADHNRSSEVQHIEPAPRPHRGGHSAPG